jgi:DnaJ-class molecular chaperone
MNYYSILNVSINATTEEIKKAYKTMALKYHPDKMPDKSSEQFKLINEAYHFLSCPEKRAMYDMTCDSKSDSQNDEWMWKFFQTLMNILKERLNKQDPKPTKKEQSSSIMKIKINITIKELYRGETKKIMLKVTRKKVLTAIPLYISLIDFQRKIVFKNMGDEEAQDVEIILNVLPDDIFKIDEYFSGYDILCFEQPLSLYEYYHGVDRKMEYFDDEIIELKNTIDGMEKMWIKIEGKGFLYFNATLNEIVRGDLIVHFKLNLPLKESIPEDIIENILSIYYK